MRCPAVYRPLVTRLDHPVMMNLRRTPRLAGLVALALAPHVSAQTPAPPQWRERAVALDVALDYRASSLTGTVRLTVENWSPSSATQIPLLLNRLMEVRGATDAAGKPLRVQQDVVRFSDLPLQQVVAAVVTVPVPVAPRRTTTINVSFAGNLVGYTETGSLYIRDRVDSAFTILRTDAFAFPSVGVPSWRANRGIPREDFAFELAVRVPGPQSVATGGAFVGRDSTDAGITWRYRSQGPVPFLNVVVAPYVALRRDGISVFTFPDDSAGGERVLASTLRALALFSRWFGDIGDRPDISISEIPDGWGSQASLTGGIIQTAAAFRDTARVVELYHEISHLWNAPDKERPSPRWNEGLARYLQFAAYQELNGWRGLDRHLDSLVRALVQRGQRDTTLRTVPLQAYGTAGVTGNSYTVGEVFFALLHRTVGDSAFRSIVGGYWRQYRSTGGTTRDFVEFAARQTPINLDRLVADWIFTTAWYDAAVNAGTFAELVRRYRP